LPSPWRPDYGTLIDASKRFDLDAGDQILTVSGRRFLRVGGGSARRVSILDA